MMKIYGAPAGAILLGAISALAVVLFVVKHRGFREWTLIGILFCLGALGTLAWLVPPQTWPGATSASFFYAGIGISLCSISAQALWGVGYASIRRSSWQRREWTPPLPPLESVSKAYRSTTLLSSAAWTLALIIWLADSSSVYLPFAKLLIACGASSIAFLSLAVLRWVRRSSPLQMPSWISSTYSFGIYLALLLGLLSQVHP